MQGRIYKTFFPLLLLSIPVLASASVSQLTFTTEPQTITPSTISGTITVQLQDSSGASANSTETVDVIFSSTSVTGEFLSPSSENVVTKTISTGSANKNFRYRDSAMGSFTITVTATGRTSGAVWSAHQDIVVSNSASGSASSTATTTSTTSNQSSNSSGSTVVPGNTYVYYSSMPLSTVTIEEPLELGAGRDRMGTVGSPLEFQVQTNIPYLKNSVFKWNFGDGSENVGETVLHTYDYPGEYVVMLNSSSPGGQAVARANVKIIKPELSVIAADSERIEVRNDSKQEISLFGRVLWAKGIAFVFPQDTIIKPGQSISFSSRITGLTPAQISEVNLLVIGSTEQSKIALRIEEEKTKQVAYLENQIALLQSQLALMPKLIRNSEPVQALSVDAAFPVVSTTTPAQIESESQTATAVKSGWFEKMKKFFLSK